MRITKLSIKKYKNLENFEWELNPDYPVAVIVGKNGSGKTNLLEAIITIFQDLQLYSEIDKRNTLPDFEFEIIYQHLDDIIRITNNGELKIWRNETEVGLDELETLRQDVSGGKDILPKTIFVYYAGSSLRLKNLVNKSISQYQILSRQPNFQYALTQPLFYYEPIHYRCVFLSLFVSTLDIIKEDFLKTDLKIEKLESADFTISDADAPAYLQRFIGFLKEHGERQTTLEKNHTRYRILAADLISEFQGNEMYLFRQVSNLALARFLTALEFRFKKQDVAETLKFSDLSEGEWQRIAIRGAMGIFQGEETLFLLDEPDTFAHPRWQWDFAPDLEKTIGENKNAQAIFITHSPLVLSTIKDNDFMMMNGAISPIDKKLYGEKLEIVLSEMHGDSNRVEADFKNYFEFIEKGEGESPEALEIRKVLEEKYGVNHSEIARADMWIAFYK